MSRLAAKPVGEWNQARIPSDYDHVEHWLNGIETARYAIDTPFREPDRPAAPQYGGPFPQPKNPRPP